MGGFDITDSSVFKFWRLNNPNAGKLLKEIVFQWRQSSAHVKTKPGKWVVYPIAHWAQSAGLSSDQTERALRRLVDDGLIIRERHRFAGTEVRAFIQPTAATLKHLGRPLDLARISPQSAGANAVTDAGASAGTSAGTDYTSLPSKPSQSSKTKEPSSPCSEGKGKARGKPRSDDKTEPKKKLKLKISKGSHPSPEKAPAPHSPPPPTGQSGVTDDDAEFDKHVAALQAKQTEKSLKQFPELKGPHEAKVKHPSHLYPKWNSFSPEAKANLYATYKTYVENAQAAAKAKAVGFGKAASHSFDCMTDEELEAMEAEYAAFAAQLAAEFHDA